MLPQGMLPLLRGGAGEATSIPEPHSITAPPHHAQPSKTILTGTVMSCHVFPGPSSTYSSISISAAVSAATL